MLERTLAENAWEVDAGLYRILLPVPEAVSFVNAFVLTSQGQYLLIDCGLNWDPSLRALGRALKAIGVPSGGLTYLLLTHRHSDHAGGSGPVQRRWGGRTLLHPQAIGRQPIAREALHAWLLQHGVDPDLAAAVLGSTARHFQEDLPEPIDPLPVGGSITLGDLHLQVIAAPGHAPDMVMLHEPERRWLFSADLVPMVPAPNSWLFPNSVGDPLGDYLASLEKATALAGGLWLPSHGMPRREGLAAMAAATADQHRRLADGLLHALAERPRTAWELVQLTLPRRTEAGALRYAMGQVLAQLTWLAGRGQVALLPGGRWEARTSL